MFVNRAIPVANGTEGVLSTLVANGSERVKRCTVGKLVIQWAKHLSQCVPGFRHWVTFTLCHPVVALKDALS